MARTVLTVVGYAVGFYFGGPSGGAVGAAIGGLIGGELEPNAKQVGPRLNDLKGPQASYGTPIAYVEGAPRLAGTYVYASDKREIANESSEGGKGGPGVDTTLFTYEMDVLVLFSINQLVGIRRVWSNGKLVWTRAEDADIESLITSNQTNSWRDMRFYSGAPDQLPDSTYEAAVGIGNAPAYRGRASVFIEGLNLGGSGQLPVLTFEVMSSQVLSYVTDSRAGVSSYSGVGLIPAGTCSLNPAGCEIHVPKFDATYTPTPNAIRVYSITDNNARVFEDPAGRGYELDSSGFVVHGTSDEDVFVLGTGIRQAKMWDAVATSGSIIFDFGLTNAPESYRFARRGGSVVFAGGDRKLYRFGLGGGNPAATSGALLMPVPAQSLAISTDGYVYVARGDGVSILQYDLSTLTLQDTIAKPAGAAGINNLRVMCDGPHLYLLADDDLYRREGATWALKMGNLPPELSIRGTRQDFAVWDEVFWSLDDGGTGATYRIHAAALTVTPDPEPLDEVVSRMCLRTGQLAAGDIDVTALASDSVRALAISQAGPTRQALEILMAAYLFEAVEGQKIKFVKRGGAPVLTLPYDHLGASTDGTAEPLPLRRLNDVELPARLTVKYANVLNDFQDGAESGDRLVTQSTAVSVVELPLGFTPTEAKRIADVNTMDLAVSLIGIGPVGLTRRYSQLEPTDVVLIAGKDGSTYRSRIQKASATAQGVNVLEMVLDDASIITSVAATDSSYSGSTLVRSVSSTQLAQLDIPLLRDADDSPGWYAAFTAGTRWPGAALLRSSDDVTFSQVLNTTTKSVVGVTTTVLGPWTGGLVFDERNSVTVNVGEGALSSVTRDALLTTTSNAMLIGSEIIQFRTATLLSAGVYKLTGLLRGARGTEWAMAGHAVDELVVLLSPSALRRVNETSADIGVPAYWKAVTIGKTSASVASRAFTNMGVSHKPFSVVDLRRGGDAATVAVTWKRRTRYATRFTGGGGISVPLGEASERYNVELRSPLGTLVSSETVSAPTWTGVSATVTGELLLPSWGLRVVGSDLFAVRNLSPASYAGAQAFVRMDLAGTLIEQSPDLGTEVYQWAAAGGNLYAATADIATGLVSSYTAGNVRRVEISAMGTIAATYTAATAGDPAGVACDGTHVWITERTSGNLRRLDASTLVSTAVYSINAGLGALYHDSGKLWICSWATSEVIEWDIATTSILQRFTVVYRPFDLLLVGGQLFVQGANEVGVYTKATGTLVTKQAAIAPSGLPQRSLALFGAYVAAADTYQVRLLDSTTGLLSRTLRTGAPYVNYMALVRGQPGLDAANSFFFHMSGANAGRLYLTVGAPGQSASTLGYELSAPGLTGYSLTVAQIGAVGNGYPTTLVL